MNIQEYIKKWSGKKVDFDGYYGYQCVDLVRHFCKEVLEVGIGPSGGSAKTMWANKHGTFNKNWTKIKNDPTDKNQVPQAGDIIFWIGGKFSKYGHVGIVEEGFLGQNKIDILDQNNGTGNGNGIGKNAIGVREYTYTNIAGWFRYKEADELVNAGSEELQEIAALKEALKSANGLAKQYQRENGILRKRAANAITALTGE